MIDVLIAEDSATARGLLLAVVNEAPGLRVCGTATNGVEALALAKASRPDVVLMDIQMPLMDGLVATERIMAEAPTSIIIVSLHHDVRSRDLCVQALRAGAVTLMPKPSGPEAPDFDVRVSALVGTIRSLAGARQPRREVLEAKQPKAPVSTPTARRAPEIAVVAASTGGPSALCRFVAALEPDFERPLLVVQHMAPGFIASLPNIFVDRPRGWQVKVAADEELLAPRTVYLAPDARHMRLRDRRRIVLGEPLKGWIGPSADELFTSAAEAFGAGVVALILTGMGDDGVRGARAVRAAGGLVAAQSAESCVIDGMPGAAIAAGLVDHVAAPRELAAWLYGLGRSV